jgi:hypothetical protein
MTAPRRLLATVMTLTSIVAACGGDGGDGGGRGGFLVSGRVVSHAAARLAAVAGAAETPRVVSHVMAVTPSSQEVRRVVARVASDGRFNLDLDPDRSWVLVFLDASRIGTDMISGVFRAETLDTLTPTADGEAELGDVEIGPDGTAAASIGYDELLIALGLDAGSALLLGEVDDLCLRYINPDIDGDGVLDAEQPDHDLRLDFHTHFGVTVDGNVVTVADLVGDFAAAAATAIEFRGTGVYASFPRSFYPGDLSATGSVSFDGDFHYTSFGPDSAAGVALAGTWISGTALVVGAYSDYQSFGPYASPGFNLPHGDYRFKLGDTILTFTAVRTRTDAELTAATNFIMAFLRITPTDANCTSNCAIAAIDYRWMKRDGAEWALATQQELALVVSGQGGYLSIVFDHDNGNQRAGIVIPSASPSGTIPWTAANARLEGVSELDFLSATTGVLCHVGLSYDDKLGMRMFATINNAPATCANQ